MPYRERLKPWAVVRLLPNFQRVTVARCRNESDASGYCQILRRLDPEAELIVIFDPADNPVEESVEEMPTPSSLPSSHLPFQSLP